MIAVVQCPRCPSDEADPEFIDIGGVTYEMKYTCLVCEHQWVVAVGKW